MTTYIHTLKLRDGEIILVEQLIKKYLTDNPKDGFAEGVLEKIKTATNRIKFE